MRAIFIHGKTGTIGGEFKKNAAGFREINRLEPKAIDHRRRTRAALEHARANFQLMRFIVHAPGQMMNAAGALRAATRRRHFVKINVRPGFSVADAVAMPSVFDAEVGEPHRLGKK